MSNSKTKTLESQREELHFRRIDMRAYRRSDGLFEVEGWVTDRKGHDFAPPGARENTVRAGDPIHDMGLRIVFDESLLVHDIETFTSTAPYESCPMGGYALKRLKGLHMTSGWNKEIRAKLSPPDRCTHLMELLGPLATTAFQSLAYLRVRVIEAPQGEGRSSKIDSCYAYAADGELVQRLWPAFQLTEAKAPK